MPPFEGSDVFPGNSNDEPDLDPPANGGEAPGPVPAGFLEDEGEDVLDLEDLIAFGLLTPPPSPNAPEDVEWVEKEPQDLQIPVFQNDEDYAAAAEFAWQQLGEFMQFFEYLEAEENGGPGVAQAPAASASGSIDPVPEDDDINEVD